MTERKPATKAEQKPQKASTDTPLTGVYVATEQLFVGGVLAFNPGDRVPAGHVERFKWRDKVRDFDTETEGED